MAKFKAQGNDKYHKATGLRGRDLNAVTSE
jgi:hypothetical protein